ncbi:hypothetical protein Tco_0628953 [Tanacetum coccineum]|uniref:DUF8039 domain-containing protein n=1 Tax=Tanacetum coccineum TaxID=301880 RepID=A0ABQ4WSJ3_9ASTR
MENQSDVQKHLVEIQADDHDLLVNSDNENDDMLGYESEKYSDDEDADGTNHAEDADGTKHSDIKLVKRGITRLYKFRREYGKPGGLKIKVTFDALNRVSGLHRALFSSFLGDLRYFDVDLTVRKLVMHHLGKLLRNFRMKLREKYILTNLNTPSKLNKLQAKYSVIVKAEEWAEFVNYTTSDAYKIKNKEIEADEEPSRSIMWLKGRVNKDGEFTDDDIRSVGDKLKEADDKIKKREVMQEEWEVELHTRVTPMGAYELDGTQSSVVVRDKDERIKKKSNGLVTSEKEPVKTVRPKKTPMSRRNGSQDSKSQRNVSPTQELPTASKCKLWHLKKSNIVALGTVYKSVGKQMLHNQALPNDCYKVSIDSSLVDAACIPDCMRTRNSHFPNNSPVTIPRRRNRRRAPNIVEPELHTIVEVTPMAERTMEELLRAPTEGYGEAIVIPKINADHFEINTNLLQLVQASPFHIFERENPHTHINNFKRITSTLKFRDVPNDVIKLMMFPYSLEGAARVWMNSTSRESSSKTDERIDKLADQILTLVKIVSKKVVTPAMVKAVEESCVTCGGAHAYNNCPTTNSNQSSVCAATGTYNQVAPPNRASNQMAPSGLL